ncbi:MAG: nuclear transport factor 2 family protein [Candidatus Binatia bacterium]
MANLEETVAALARRVEQLEDELAIHRLIVRYGIGVDAGDPERGAAVFTEDGVYDVDVGRMEGREAVRGMIRGPRHQEMVGHCAHQIGPVVVTLDGSDRATAVGYSRVYLATRAGTHIYRVSFNTWKLVKQGGEWLIARRTTRMLGCPDAVDVIR